MGLKGMTAGGLAGGFIGGIAGVASLLILNASGMTMEDMRYWQYKWRQHRDDTIEDAKKKSIEGTEHDDEHIKAHDEKVGSGKLDLASLDEILKGAAKENEAVMRAAAKEAATASNQK